jgi:hypothetical protein
MGSDFPFDWEIRILASTFLLGAISRPFQCLKFGGLFFWIHILWTATFSRVDLQFPLLFNARGRLFRPGWAESGAYQLPNIPRRGDSACWWESYTRKAVPMVHTVTSHDGEIPPSGDSGLLVILALRI